MRISQINGLSYFKRTCMNVWVSVLLTWYCIHVISYIKHIVCNELSDVKIISLDCLYVQQYIRTINSKDKSYPKKCVRVWITSVPPAIVTSYCFKLMTMIMMMITDPRLLVKPYVVSGPPLYCNKDVTHNTTCLFASLSLSLAASFGSFCPLNSCVPTAWLQATFSLLASQQFAATRNIRFCLL